MAAIPQGIIRKLRIGKWESIGYLFLKKWRESVEETENLLALIVLNIQFLQILQLCDARLSSSGHLYKKKERKKPRITFAALPIPAPPGALCWLFWLVGGFGEDVNQK